MHPSSQTPVLSPPASLFVCDTCSYELPNSRVQQGETSQGRKRAVGEGKGKIRDKLNTGPRATNKKNQTVPECLLYHEPSKQSQGVAGSDGKGVAGQW